MSRISEAAPVGVSIGPSRDRLDAGAAACAFLANLLLREEAGAHAAATLTEEDVEAWPLERDADTTAGLELLQAVVGSRPDKSDITTDYRRLFIGPGPAEANPYESVHLSLEGLTFEEQTIQVRRAYAEFGLAAPALGREPDDHIGLELAFVGELLVAALDATERADAEGAATVLGGAETFLREHLLAWGPTFAGLVVDRADTDLYRAVGLLLRGALPQLHRAVVYSGGSLKSSRR